MWTGTGLDTLSNEDDDYGHLPLSYTINEFINPYRWFGNDEVIDHNTFVWFDLTEKDLYREVIRTEQYIILKRDNLYYTFVACDGGRIFASMFGLVQAAANPNGDIQVIPHYVRGYSLIVY